MKPKFFVAVGLLALIASGPPLVASISSPVLVSAVQAAETEQTATFNVPGMFCALCPVTVRKAMESVEGVKSVVIDFEARTATVAFDPARATAAAIAAASANAGYPAEIRG